MMNISQSYWIGDTYHDKVGFLKAKDCNFKKENLQKELENELMEKIELIISNYGRVRKFYKYNYRHLKTFRKGSIQIVKLTINGKGKDYNVAKLVVEAFVSKLKDNEVVYHKNGVIADNELSNLEILTRTEAGRRTGWQSRRKGIVMLNDEGIISRIFKGTRDAADKLFISRQTVSDYCNKKVINPMYKLYWADELIEEEEK